MKNLRRTCAVAVVTAVLAVAAFAGTINSPGKTGIISSPGAVPTPTPTPSETSSSSTSTSVTTTVIFAILSLIR